MGEEKLVIVKYTRCPTNYNQPQWRVCSWSEIVRLKADCEYLLRTLGDVVINEVYEDEGDVRKMHYIYNGYVDEKWSDSFSKAVKAFNRPKQVMAD